MQSMSVWRMVWQHAAAALADWLVPYLARHFAAASRELGHTSTIDAKLL